MELFSSSSKTTIFTRPNRSLITAHIFYHIMYHIYQYAYACCSRFWSPFYAHNTHIVSIRTPNSSKLWRRVIYFEFIKLWICQSKTTIYFSFDWRLYCILCSMFIHILYISMCNAMDAWCILLQITDDIPIFNSILHCFRIRRWKTIVSIKMPFGKLKWVMEIPHQYHQSQMHRSHYFDEELT